MCRNRPGWSGYATMTADGWEHQPCRCVTDATVADLYGSNRNRLAMLKELSSLNRQIPPDAPTMQPLDSMAEA